MILGRGNVSERERKYWVLAHEMDHFRAYFDFWVQMCLKIFSATNATYKTEADCIAAIDQLQYNNLLNHLNARRKSAAFDSYPRGVPQCGKRYEKFKFATNESFHWIPSEMIDKTAWDEVVRNKRPERLSESYAGSLQSMNAKDEIKQAANKIIASKGFSAFQAEWQKLTLAAGAG